jgi:hypothetical protein
MVVWALIAVGFLSITAALPTISTAGSKFYDSDGNQFFIKGTAPQFGRAGIPRTDILQELRTPLA